MAKDDDRNKRRRERYNFWRSLGFTSKEAKAPAKTIKEKPEKAPTLSGLLSEYVTDPIRKALNTVQTAVTGKPSNTKPKRQTKQTRASPKRRDISFADWLTEKGYSASNKPANKSITQKYRDETGQSIGNVKAGKIIRQTLDIPFNEVKSTKYRYHHPTKNTIKKKYVGRGDDVNFSFIISYWVKDSNGTLSQRYITIDLEDDDPERALEEVYTYHYEEQFNSDRYNMVEVYEDKKHPMRIKYAIDYRGTHVRR